MINFGPGAIYISNHDGTSIKFADVNDSSIECECECEDELNYISNDISPIKFQINNIIEASFEATCRMFEEALLYISGARDVVVKCCPNRKVAYLATHSKKRRTRKKNIHRAIKILEELAND